MSTSNFPVLVASVGILFVVSKLWRAHTEMSKLDAIPTVGPNGFFNSLISGMRYIKHAREMIKEGYEKYHGRAFKIRMPNGWIVIATGPDLVNDIKKAPDEFLSFDEAVNDALEIDYTLGRPHREHLYHVNVVKNALTRNIAVRFDDVRDEIMTAFREEIPVSDDWTSIAAYDTIMRIVCRTTNRLFVGLPLCRDPDWIDLNIQFTIKVFTSAAMINLFPDILKPIVGNLLTPRRTVTRRARRHIEHVIKDRMDKEDQLGRDWEGKPNDLVSWLLAENPGGKYRTVEDITMRLLNVNMAAIHTTSMTFSTILYYLAVQPDSVIQALRDEIESVVEQHGWNKVSMGYLRKVDSFMKETARINGISEVGSGRKVLKDFTFSDGTRVPAGTLLSIPLYAMHHDERHYEDPDEFKPFRFSDMRGSEENGSIKHQMITPNSDYFFFGSGRHACPGRFFAVNELKTLVAHTLLTYDVKLEGFSKEVPEPTLFSSSVLPDQKAKVLFRKRRV